jgi:hypothetical protein
MITLFENYSFNSTLFECFDWNTNIKESVENLQKCTTRA